MTRGKALASAGRKAEILVWAPIALDGAISGSKVNETQRIKILSQEFIVYAFVLVSFTSMNKRREYVNKWFHSTNARIIVLPSLECYGTQLLSRIAAATIVALSAILLRLSHKVDLIIARQSVSSLPLIVASKLTGVPFLFNVVSVPFVHTEMELVGGSLLRSPRAVYVIKLADYFVLRHSDWVGVVDHAAAQNLVATFGHDYRSKIVLLPFPVSEDFYNGFSSESKLKTTIELCYGGSIHHLYDFSQLMKALEALNSRSLVALLTIYTSHKGRERLKAYRFGVAPFLILKKEVPREELIAALRESTGVVIPHSRHFHRGISMKAVEAMAIGVPVIIFNPGDSEIFRDGETCFVVSDDSPQAWEKAIMRAIIPEQRRQVVREARVEAEAFKAERNVDVICELLKMPRKNAGRRRSIDATIGEFM